MKFEFRPVKKKIDLGEYAEEMRGGVIEVRVNVARALLSRMVSVSEETTIEEFLEILAELWGEAWPAEELRAFYEHCREYDPQLWRWVCSQTFLEVFEYQTGQKKR